MRVKAVLFDLVGTLVKLVESPKTYTEFLRLMELKFQPRNFLRLRANEKEFDVTEARAASW